ncbi:MAG: alginate O-acetyltransferase AlgX-related protein [Candidatus Helarchaeota archaeon]
MRLTKAFAYTLLRIVITFLILELSLQAFYYFTSKQPLFTRFAVPIYINDKIRMHAVKPYLSFRHKTQEFNITIYTNSQGFRVSENCEEYPIQRDFSKFRIMLLGPSFAFGWGVNYEDSFAAKLKEILEDNNSNLGRNIEIINAGVPSLSDFRQLIWFKKKGREYKPDLVIKFIYGSMVISNRDEYKNHVTKKGYLVNNKKLTFFENIRKKLRYSAIIHYSWMLYNIIKARVRSPKSNKEKIIGAGRELENYTDFNLEDNSVLEAISYYEDLLKSVDSIGAHLLILYFPLSYCVHREDMPRWEIYGVKDVKKQIMFNQKFCQYLNDLGYDCLNITQDLIQESKKSNDRLYYFLDLHWTPKGNLVVACSTARHLIKNLKKYNPNNK